jgi:hypothetical protein
MEAGILMTEDVTRFAAGTPRLIYAARTDPAIVEKPDVIVRSSLKSALGEKGKREKHTKFGFCHHLRYLGLGCGTEDAIIDSRSTYGRTRHADSPIDTGGGVNICKPVFPFKLNVPWPIQGDAAATTASAPETFISLKKNQALFDTCKKSSLEKYKSRFLTNS